MTTTTTMGVPDTTTASAIPCKSWKDAATAASAVFYANEGHFPTTFTDLITGTPPLLEITERVTVTANTVTGSGWTLTMRGGGARDPETLTCS